MILMQIKIFIKYEATNCPFYAIHLSDEHCSDPIDWYNFSMCKGVVRNYVRNDCKSNPKVLILPLGPAARTKEVRPIQERKLLWSFFGTKWFNRQTLLEPLNQIGPNECKYYNDWLSPDQLKREEYSEYCLKSLFMPCPRGNNIECFRLWEALEHGAIPLYVREPGDELFFEFISSSLGIVSLPSWNHAHDFMKQILQNGIIQYRDTLIHKWTFWKKNLVKDSRKILALEY